MAYKEVNITIFRSYDKLGTYYNILIPDKYLKMVMEEDPFVKLVIENPGKGSADILDCLALIARRVEESNIGEK